MIARTLDVKQSRSGAQCDDQNDDDDRNQGFTAATSQAQPSRENDEGDQGYRNEKPVVQRQQDVVVISVSATAVPLGDKGQQARRRPRIRAAHIDVRRHAFIQGKLRRWRRHQIDATIVFAPQDADILQLKSKSTPLFTDR